MPPNDALTYRQAGVDIEEAQRALRAIANGVQSTHNDRVIGGIGGFGGLFRASFPEIENPVLVSSIDGVGTKTKVAAMAGNYQDLGKDLVNHCINDILCQGAKPLFFLDYYGCSRLSGLMFEEVLSGMTQACAATGCALVGGETAEMPGVYVEDEIDLVGCIVGVVDASKKLPRGKMEPGTAIIGLMSDGLHTNGYTLARRALFDLGGHSVRDEISAIGNTLGEELLRPHRCYLNAVYPLLQESESIFAIAHVTGGGLYDNLPRVMPSDVKAVIERRSWTVPPIFRLIQEAGNVPDADMFRTFNMGIGMVLFTRREAAPGLIQKLHLAGETAMLIGEIQAGAHDVQIV